MFRVLFKLAIAFAAVAFILPTLAAALGFANPILDAFNHLQPFMFLGTLIVLLLVPLAFRAPRFRAFMLAVSATGFLASAMIVIPEAISALVVREPVSQERANFRLMTFNVFGRNFNMDRVYETIAAVDPDIITIQEYFAFQRLKLDQLLVEDYPFSHQCRGPEKRANIAIYARIPFSMKAGQACGTDDGRVVRIFADFAPEGSAPFTVATTHLDWPIQISVLRGSGNFAAGIVAMSARKRAEFDDLSAALSEVDGPVIIAGDFNSTSWSYSLRGFAQRNGLERHTRNLFTFPKAFHLAGAWRTTPAFLPLDHVMSRNGIIVHAVELGDASGSDHAPVIVDFSVPLE